MDAAPETNSVEVYTIGHSNVPAERIIELLRAQHVEVLVDVRSMPYSQYVSQFNRETFARTLEAVGIVYRFAGEYLGGRPKDPTCYLDDEVPDGKANYLKRVDYAEVARRDWYQKGIARLVEIAADRPTAIMCSEEDPNNCHRQHLITRTLLDMGVAVRHIRGSGAVEAARSEAQPSSEADQAPEQLQLF